MTPSSAVYCIGIFALMLLSLLETIFVMHLMEKDNHSEDDDVDADEDGISDERNMQTSCDKQHGGENQRAQVLCMNTSDWSLCL